MKSLHPSLTGTERRLITLFVGGAFLFLVIFEGLFLGARFIFENQFAKDLFQSELKRKEMKIGMGHQHKKPPVIPILSTLVVSRDGELLATDMGPSELLDEIKSSFDADFIKNLELDVITLSDGIYYKKMTTKDPLQFKIYVSKSGYPLEDLLRDIIRFLLMDLFIVAPFYFMGRYFVRETLEPVGKNIDMMGHFIHNAGHELKTPLAIISGNLQILGSEKIYDAELVDSSIKTLYSMGESIDGLLEITSTEHTKGGENVVLSEILQDILTRQKDLIETKKLQIHQNGKKEMTYQMSRKHLTLILSNLLSNAIKYNKEFGKINISWTKHSITIQDSGIGIQKEFLEKIWERFFRVDKNTQDGNGIGLSLVEHIVTMYNWKIDVESEKGIGTTFTIKIH